MTKLNRCAWCSSDPAYIKYHDEQWGVPLFDAHKLFELLMLESFQAGLSWLTVLKKRDSFAAEFADFDAAKIATFSDARLERALQNPAIIRNRSKVFALRNNARAWLELEDPGQFLWDVVNGLPISNHFAHIKDVPTKTLQSENLSKKLKQAGFVRFGATTCYAFMQASGMVMDHTTDCFRYLDLTKN